MIVDDGEHEVLYRVIDIFAAERHKPVSAQRNESIRQDDACSRVAVNEAMIRRHRLDQCPSFPFDGAMIA